MPLPTEANVTRPVAAGYHFLIEYGTADADSLYLRGAVGPGREFHLQTVIPESGPDTSTNPEDMRGETGKPFSRSSFTGGEGLDRAHRRDGTDRDWARFWDSRNINITPGRAGNPDEVKLLHSASNIRADDAGNIRMPLMRIGTTLYSVCSSQVDVDRTADPTATTPAFTVEDPHAGEGDQDVVDLTVLGSELYAAITTNGIHKRSSSGTWTHWAHLAATRLWGVKGRVIASTGASLYEALAGGTAVTLDSGTAVDDILTETGHGLSDGDEIQFLTLTGGTGLTTFTTYYVVSSTTDTFQLAATSGGAAINFTSDITAATYTALVDSTLLKTLPTGQTWTDVIDAGIAILAGASNGEITAFINEDGDLVERATFIFEGEQITALGFGQGFVFIGTGEPTTGGGKIGRLWRSQLIGLRFQSSQVLREWGDGSTTLDRSPQRIITTREAMFTGIIDSATESHLWKYHLETAGMTRDLILDDGLVQGLAMVDDRMFATVFVDGLWRENTTYATTGYLISPLADFFNAAKKTWVGARLTTGDMPTGTDLVLAYSTDPDAIVNSAHSSWTTIISADENSSGDLGETAITGVEARYVAGKLTLTPNGAATSTPIALAFSFRGLPLPIEEDYAIPVNVSDRLELPGRKPLTVPGIGHAILDKLHAIKGKAVTLTVLRDSEQVIGQLRSIGTPYQGITEEGSLGTYSQVIVRGVRQ